MKKRVVIYTRVSRDDSGKGESTQRQEQDCRQYAELQGWQVVDVAEDISISAYSGKARPAWERVMEMMRAGSVDLVLAWHMDRVTRTVRELTDIIALSRETGVNIATVREGDINLSNETGKAVATILGAISEMEVERKGARQRRANQQRRAEGKRWASGWRPFGYERDGTVIPSEADLIRQAAQDVLTGTSIREIARRWKELGVSTPRSKKGADGWTHSGVRAILLNPRNAGLNTYKGEVIGPGDWEAIFPEDVHVRLKATLTDPSRNAAGNRGRSVANLLSGIATCARCGDPVVGGTVGRTAVVDGVRKSTGVRVPVYKCRKDHLSTNRGEVDALVVAAFSLGISSIVSTQQLMPVSSAGQGAHLGAELERIDGDLRGLASSFAEGRITMAQMEVATAALQQQRDEIEKRISETPETDDLAALISENARDFRNMEVAQQRLILDRSARIVLYPKGRGKKSVPVRHQVTMHAVTSWRDGTERLIPLLDERPADLPAVNTEPQKRDRARPETSF